MALESATYINGLNSSNPVSGDPVSAADDHIRLLKAAIKATFPNISAAMTLTAATLNAIPASIAAEGLAVFNKVKAHLVPTGVILMWSGSSGSIPAGWALCNGTGGTPDLRDRFVIGAGSTYAVGATGGSVTPTTSSSGAHAHANATGAGVAPLPQHSHALLGINDSDSSSYGLETTSDAVSGVTRASGSQASAYITTSSGAASSGKKWVQDTGTAGNPTHTHTIASDGAHTHTVTAMPPYYALCYIQKISTTPTAYP